MFFIVLPRKFRMDQSALEFLFCCDFNWEIEGKFSRIVICEQWIKLTDFMMLDEEVKLPWRMSWNYWYEIDDSSSAFIRFYWFCFRDRRAGCQIELWHLFVSEDVRFNNAKLLFGLCLLWWIFIFHITQIFFQIFALLRLNPN